MRKKFRKNRFQAKNISTKCHYCETKTLPDYTEISVLEKFLTERGKIISRSRTGMCNSHQKKLTKAIKYARHMAFLPFVISA